MISSLRKELWPVCVLAALALGIGAADARAGASAWDGQYELEGEGDSGVPFHHYLVFYTSGGTTRVTFNSKELSNVVLTTNGFDGSVGGEVGHFVFSRVEGVRAIGLPGYQEPGWHVETRGKPLLQTKGPKEAAGALKRVKEASKEFERFKAAFQAALAVPETQCRERLAPLFRWPLRDERPQERRETETAPDQIRGISDDLLALLRAGGYTKCGRGVGNGPFEYLLVPDRCLRPDGGPNLVARQQADGKFLIAEMVYLP